MPLVNPSGGSFLTADTTPLPANGVNFTANHGLPYVPVNYDLELVCLTAEHGYAVGDVVQVVTGWSGTALSVTNKWADATVVGVTVQSSCSAVIKDKVATNAYSPTAGNWAYRFRVWKR